MKKVIVLTLSMVIILALFTGCKSKTIEIQGVDGEVIEVNTDGLTDEQITALEDIENGESNIMMIMRSGLFTQEKLNELGLMPEDSERNIQGNMPGKVNGMDFTDTNIDDLNLDGLTDEQIDAVKALIAGEKTMQEVISSNILSNEDFVNIGLMNNNTDLSEGKGNRPNQGNNN